MCSYRGSSCSGQEQVGADACAEETAACNSCVQPAALHASVCEEADNRVVTALECKSKDEPVRCPWGAVNFLRSTQLSNGSLMIGKKKALMERR